MRSDFQRGWNLGYKQGLRDEKRTLEQLESAKDTVRSAFSAAGIRKCEACPNCAVDSRFCPACERLQG